MLAPTRELAQQIEKVMRALGDYLQVKVHACVGGTSVREDQRILQSGVHVVVGTPGRVYDMLRRNALRADAIKCFVLDEADEMLSRGFKDQVCIPLSQSLTGFFPSFFEIRFFCGIKRLKFILLYVLLDHMISEVHIAVDTTVVSFFEISCCTEFCQRTVKISEGELAVLLI